MLGNESWYSRFYCLEGVGRSAQKTYRDGKSTCYKHCHKKGPLEKLTVLYKCQASVLFIFSVNDKNIVNLQNNIVLWFVT